MEKNASNKLIEDPATILVASDNSSDAVLVKDLLTPEFDQVFVSINQDKAAEDFESRAPNVLVLAFNALEKAERYYLGLYRQSEHIHAQPHRTLILCKKEEVNSAYQACRKGHFDDYILFWPMTNDAPRLLMSVHHALRDLAAGRSDGPSVTEFAAQARRLGQLGSMLDRQVTSGNEQIEIVNRVMKQAEQGISATLDGFSGGLVKRELLKNPGIETAEELEKVIKQFTQNDVKQYFRVAAESLSPFKQWTDELRRECAPYIESAQTLNDMADRIRPVILIVDDDEFQCKTLNRLLAAENYQLVFASSGVDALNILRKMQPDLILMDFMMPDLNGIETTLRLKAIPQLAKIPIIMITGNSEGATVRDSLKAGAVNFVVKPFDRETLLAKVAHALHA